MNAAQVKGMRNLWTAANTAPETMTAKEMALCSHNLSKTGMKATLANGKTFYWDDDKNLWVR